MTTQTYSGVLTCTDDATFRAWGLQLSNALQAAGLVKTSDTGQVDWATATRPPTNANPHYEIYRMDDAAQAVAPVYFRINYRTLTTATRPTLEVGIGTGSDGAGNLTGLGFAPVAVNSNSEPSALSVPTLVCVNEGFVGVAWAVGSTSAGYGRGGFMFCRSVDVDGDPTPEAATFYRIDNTTLPARVVNYAENYLRSQSFAYCMIPFDETSSLVGAAAQAFKHYTWSPRMRTNPFLFTVVKAEVGLLTQFAAAPVAGIERNYIGLGSWGYKAAINGNDAVHGLAMLWE